MKETVKKSAPDKHRQVIFPPSLTKNDTIGLVAPAGSLIHKKNFIAGVRILENNGFKVKFNPQIIHAKGYLAGSDRERADEFNTMWTDPDVKALIAVRGGYGCLRMVDLIDMKLIQQNPKMFIGFSDLTVLLSAITNETGLVTFHGPVITTLSFIDLQSTKSFLNTLLGKIPGQIRPAGLRILKSGTASGILHGGNLTTLTHLIGTPYEVPWQNTILFIEDIGEKPYCLDRLLTHLSKSGRLKKIRGLILGTFTDEDKKERKSLFNIVQTRIAELLRDENIPIWANFPTGHSRRNLTLPIGIKVMMDSSSGKLHL
jgi:muramoyltetrapeptide carboxypeptidase